MKKKVLILFPIIVVPSLLVAFSKETIHAVSAYDVSKLPTDLNLNDTSTSDIRSYYSSLDSLSESERQGTNLLKNLKPILKNNQKYLSYGSSATTAVWQAYEIVDRDWAKSPASEITGYDASSNTVTGYVYGKSSSNKGSNPYIRTLYVNRNASNEATAWDDHSQTNYGFNQEHVWPKSLGFDDNSNPAGARGDLMHLWAGNGRVNGQYHSNYYYGYVDTSKAYKNAGDDYSYLSGNLLGYSKTLGGTTKVFEPQDSDKGDIARAIFYMAARYNYYSGSDADGINSGNPNLEIVNNLTTFSESGYTSTTTKTGKIGVLQDLLRWNKEDPVDDFEIHRNNLLFNNYTNNRNPFIDFPQWADAIWGTVDNEGNYDTTPKGLAKPATDSINDSGFNISQSSVTLKKGETIKISATTEDSSPITWSLSTDAYITLSKTTSASGEEITITAVESGKTTITAKATIGGVEMSKTCTVNVRAELPRWVIYAAIGAGVVLLLIIIIVLANSKKARKKAIKYVKKTVKSSSSSSKKKSSSTKSSSSKKKK